MTDRFPFPGAFDPAAVRDTMQHQFGWSESDVLRAADALMPAAFAGLRRFATTPTAFQSLMALMPGPGRVGGLPDPSNLVGEPLALFFGSAETQAALADYIAGQTGLARPGVETLMPVVATLALGQIGRQFTFGPARDLLDAFLAGYARGRPKPAPNPMRMMAPYADAMRSFWDGYLGMFGQAPHDADGTLAESDGSDSFDEASATEGSAGAQGGAPDEDLALFDRWVALGRDIQDTQIRGFEAFFEQVASGTPLKG